MIAIEINPNLRVDGDKTIVDLDEDVFGGTPAVWEQVRVFEPRSGLQGKGWVCTIDDQERTATIVVDWANLRLADGNQRAAADRPTGFNFTVNTGANREAVS